MTTPGISGMPGMWPRTQNSSLRHVLVADANARLDIVVDDRRELLHFEALGIEAANFLDIGDDMIEVVLGKIENQIVFRQGDTRGTSRSLLPEATFVGCADDSSRRSPARQAGLRHARRQRITSSPGGACSCRGRLQAGRRP